MKPRTPDLVLETQRRAMRLLGLDEAAYAREVYGAGLDYLAAQVPCPLWRGRCERSRTWWKWWRLMRHVEDTALLPLLEGYAADHPATPARALLGAWRTRHREQAEASRIRPHRVAQALIREETAGMMSDG